VSREVEEIRMDGRVVLLSYVVDMQILWICGPELSKEFKLKLSIQRFQFVLPFKNEYRVEACFKETLECIPRLAWHSLAVRIAKSSCKHQSQNAQQFCFLLAAKQDVHSPSCFGDSCSGCTVWLQSHNEQIGHLQSMWNNGGDWL
jgi:hypothetical protein